MPEYCRPAVEGLENSFQLPLLSCVILEEVEGMSEFPVSLQRKRRGRLVKTTKILTAYSKYAVGTEVNPLFLFHT